MVIFWRIPLLRLIFGGKLSPWHAYFIPRMMLNREDKVQVHLCTDCTHFYIG